MSRCFFIAQLQRCGECDNIERDFVMRERQETNRQVKITKYGSNVISFRNDSVENFN